MEDNIENINKQIYFCLIDKYFLVKTSFKSLIHKGIVLKMFKNYVSHCDDICITTI